MRVLSWVHLTRPEGVSNGMNAARQDRVLFPQSA